MPRAKTKRKSSQPKPAKLPQLFVQSPGQVEINHDITPFNDQITFLVWNVDTKADAVRIVKRFIKRLRESK